MNIFKNLSNQEKKRLIKELDRKPNGIGYNEKVATNTHWLIWLNNDYHLTEEEREKIQFPRVESIVEVRMKEVDEISREKVEKALQINRVLNNEKYPAIKISNYYNAHYIKLGFALMDKTKKVKFLLNDSDHIRQSEGKIPPALTMTDGEISIMIMPLRPSSDMREFIDPDAITAADVEKARKYKVYLQGKSPFVDSYRETEKNIVIYRPYDGKTSYFAIIPKNNEFLKRVFKVPADAEKIEDFSNISFEKSENVTKHIEDIFHKKVVEAVETTEEGKYFWHFYENGTGVCFTA